jgi:putative nucleotidyltransferase with HDIG domain
VYEGQGARWLGGWRSILFALVLLGLLALLLRFHREEVYRDVPRFLIVLLSLLTAVAAASWIGGADASMMLIPAAFPALVVAALFDGLLGVATAFILAALLAGQPPFVGISVPFTVLAAGSAGALAMPWIRRRAQSWILIAAITGGYLMAGGALALLGYLSLGDWVTGVGWGAVNATTCTVFAMAAVVPALEKLTGITTDQTLLEYSDLNRPLLRRLSREAPGSYAHSVNVANLAEAACSAIGANALLARVGSYYHDVGKMTRPQYFIENQPRGRNPHDRLQPSRSAAVIREHVREGLKLAEEAGIPEVIRDFIAEHHGTQQIVYFLRKAQQQEPELDLDPGEFAYPGPKPRSREAAVVMLADGVESTTRTLKGPSAERIRELVESIVSARMEEGQLDRCPLTLQDIDRIETEFSRVLNGMYHHRIDYPGPASGGDANDPEAAAAADGTDGGG